MDHLAATLAAVFSKYPEEQDPCQIDSVAPTAGGDSDVAVHTDRTFLSLYEGRGTLLVARYKMGWAADGKP
jgi:hypothetical protein